MKAFDLLPSLVERLIKIAMQDAGTDRAPPILPDQRYSPQRSTL
jgi:hypothetical protein